VLKQYLIDNPDTRRIWCAASSTGEEPYSIAIAVAEHFNSFKTPIEIIASDIDSGVLKKSEMGIYPLDRIDTVSDIRKQRFFHRGRGSQLGNVRVVPELKQMLKFTRINLLDSFWPLKTPIDVIFCRNVLMYFWPETAKAIAAKFYQALNPYGWLITSQVELIDDYFSVFVRESYANGIFYQKKDKPLAFEVNNVKQSVLIAKPNKRLKPKKVQTARQIGLNIKSEKSSTVVAIPNSIKPETAARQTPEQLYEAANYAACIDSCREKLKNEQDNKAIRLLLVKSLANAGQLKQAAEEAEKLLETDAINPEFLNILANVLMELEEWEEAKNYLTKSLYINPNSLAIHFNMGYVYQKLGKPKQAKKHFQNLLKSLDNLADSAIVSEMDNMTAGRLRSLTLMMAGL